MVKQRQSQKTVQLRLVCVAPPVGECEGMPTEFGLQDRQQVVHPGRAHADGSLSFELSVSVTYRAEANAVRFSGPFVHGTPAAPFLYLSLRRASGEPRPWIRRIKVSLAGPTWDQLDTAPEGSLFTARVSGARSGTVPLVGEGWTRKDAIDTQ